MSISVLSWNILSGGFTDYGTPEKFPPRLNRIAATIRTLNPDILSLVDTYRWTEVFTPEKLSQIFGYPNVFSIPLKDRRLEIKGHDNGITVFTKSPDTHFETVRIRTRNAVKTRVLGNDIFSVYLDDVSEDTRLKQAKSILKLINIKIPTLVTGDMNTFDLVDLPETIQNLKILETMFPGQMKSMANSLSQMKRAQVTESFKNAGLFDLGKGKGNTVPAKLFPLKTDKPIVRIDYAFANNLLKLEDFRVLTGQTYGDLSDHYPIFMKVSS